MPIINLIETCVWSWFMLLLPLDFSIISMLKPENHHLVGNKHCLDTLIAIKFNAVELHI
jgi:hypothetical protein